MAHRAVNRESRLYVVWTGGAVVIRHVAQVAGATGQVVVVIHVALGALQVRVPIREQESRRGVIEHSRNPGGRVVTYLARSRKSRRHVVGICRAVVVGHVTR